MKNILPTYLFFNILFLINLQSLAQNINLYSDLTSQQKKDYIWNEIVKSQYSLKNLPVADSFSTSVINLLNPTYLATSFTTSSDFMPKSRTKFIHSVGSVVQFKFIPIENKYSGIFKSGGSGLLRLSLAASEDSLKSYTPGMALKFFVENQNSKNIFAMHSLDGQGLNRNPFAKNLTTDIDSPKSFVLKILSVAFSKVKSDPTVLPINHLSQFSNNGELSLETKSPYSLVFKPLQQQLISSNSKDDLRQQLSLVDSGSELYEVLAIEKIGSNPVSIGKIVTQSLFLPSGFGDKFLFFQHTK